MWANGDTLYSNQELVDMLLIYGEALQNGEEAAKLYAELFPKRNHPKANMFESIEKQVRATGELYSQKTDDCEESLNATDIEEQIIIMLQQDPNKSLKNIARELDISYSTVAKIMNENPKTSPNSYKLLSVDFAPRVEFCQWLLEQNEIDDNFLKNILFTGETTFTLNSRKVYYHWVAENMYDSINLWGGLINNTVIGFHRLPDKTDGRGYRTFIKRDIKEYLDDIPLATRQKMIFMHDDVLLHFCIEVRQFLDKKFPERWIGRGGPVMWPAHSPDLNPMEFYVWKFMENMIYSNTISTLEELRVRINEAEETIKKETDVQFVYESLLRRARLCIECEGGSFEHLL